jgi:ribosomal protein S18 acetylase RimI-like enzyme
MLRFEKDINNECLQYFAVSTPNALLIKAEDDNIVGMVDYEVHKDSVKIFYITISEEYKRQGYATETMTKIINENKGKYLYGDSLPGAIKFWASLGVEFDEDEDEEYLTPFHLNC